MISTGESYQYEPNTQRDFTKLFIAEANYLFFQGKKIVPNTVRSLALTLHLLCKNPLRN